MTKKIRRKIAGVLVMILLGITVLPSNVSATEVVSDSSENLENTSIEETEQTDQTEELSENEIKNMQEMTDEQVQSEENSSYLGSGLINYVGVEYPYLQTPCEQKLVVSFGDGSENISDAKLICQKPNGEEFTLLLSERENELYLFQSSFESSDAGVYQLLRFSYVQESVETSIDLREIGIEAMFGVDEYYPGYGEDFDESNIDPEAIEMSVVNIDGDDVSSAEGDVEEAIELTAEDVYSEEKDSEQNGNIISRATSTFLSSVADIVMPATTVQAAENKVVVLDPGHGGSDPGASASNLVEKSLNLKIAQYCKEELEEYSGVTVYMTRESDVYVGLEERVQKAKKLGADVFVSIHINSATATANGVEVWYPNSSYNTAVYNQGKDLSNAILRELVALGLKNRGIKFKDSENGTTYEDGSVADYYSVIRDSKKNGFPGIIVEHAFITNASDAAKLAQDSFLKKLGIADATGIANYFKLSKGSYIQIDKKNDFEGTAQIKVFGLGSNGTLKVWNEDTNALKSYSIANGKETLDFNVNDFSGARGRYYAEGFNSSGISLYKTSFYVSKDTSSEITVNSDGMEKQYTVNIKFKDMPSEVTKVQVPVWCAADQSDIIWYNATQVSKGNWQAIINIKDYKKYGAYNVHIYAGMTDGTMKCLGATAINVTKPTLSVETGNYQKNEGTFDVLITDVNSPSGVEKIQVPVWCASNQSDIKWYTAEKQSDGSYKVTVSMANHKYAVGEYKVHTYITTGNGMTVFGGSTPNVSMSLPDMEVSAKDVDGKETTYVLKVTNTNLLGVIKNIQFATWSVENGQDDIRWYNGSRNSLGEWTGTAEIKNHKSTGTYNVHVYATLSNGTMKYLGMTTFNVTKPTLSVETGNYQKNEGTFDVLITDVNSPSGVEKIQVPVWCASNQSDIKWYTAEKQSDGSYKVTVSMANHKYAVGEYKVHTYITTGNGMTVFGGSTPNVSMSLPDMEVSAKDVDGKETTYVLKVTNTNLLGVIKNIQFATWSVENGQDDIRWYNGSRNSLGEWTGTAEIKNHKSAGAYNVYAYAILADGTMILLGTTTFEVTKPAVSDISVESYDEDSGAFEVIISGAVPNLSVAKVQVPVWCAENQSDIKWYDAIKQDDGTYEVNVDPMYHKYNSGLYKIDVYITIESGICSYVGSRSQMVSATKYYSIMGNTSVTVEQMMSYFKASGHEYPSIELGAGGASTLEQFCNLYCEEAAAEGVRAEVAFAQAMKETGWLQYGGIVKVNQFNFAGLGALDGNSSGNCASFPDVRTGIRAQIQHLKAYASTELLNNTCVDPRFNLVTRGCAPYVEWLGQKENPTGKGWATAAGYGTSIVTMIKKMKSH